MGQPSNEPLWHHVTQEVMSGLRAWRLSIRKLRSGRSRPNSTRAGTDCVRGCSKLWHSRARRPRGRGRQPRSSPLVPSAAAHSTSVARIPAPCRPTVVRISSWNAAPGSVRSVGPAFFPLDEELGLLPGRLTPRLQEAVTRLSTWIPAFAKAATEVAWFTQVQVSADTARRVTETAGAVAVALETADASCLLQAFPRSPAAPDTHHAC